MCSRRCYINQRCIQEPLSQARDEGGRHRLTGRQQRKLFCWDYNSEGDRRVGYEHSLTSRRAVPASTAHYYLNRGFASVLAEHASLSTEAVQLSPPAAVQTFLSSRFLPPGLSILLGKGAAGGGVTDLSSTRCTAGNYRHQTRAIIKFLTSFLNWIVRVRNSNKLSTVCYKGCTVPTVASCKTAELTLPFHPN